MIFYLLNMISLTISELCPTWLRGTSVGLIEQNPTLFATTVMENIRYGKPTASDEQVKINL